MKVTDLKENEVIWCPTEDKANKLMKVFDDAGLRWSNGWKYSENNCYSWNRKDTCYHPSKGEYGCKYSYEEKEYTIHHVDKFIKMQFPKNTAIQCDTWEQVEQLCELFERQLHFSAYEEKKDFKNGWVYLKNYKGNELYLSINASSEPIKHANEYLMNLELKPEALLKAYNEGCADVKKVLKNLYPDFEFEKSNIELKGGIVININGSFYCNILPDSGNNGRLYLSSQFNWKLEKEGVCYYLIPTKK